LARVLKASKALDHGWLEVHLEIQNLRTEAGARALYRKNPGLAQAFPTEAAVNGALLKLTESVRLPQQGSRHAAHKTRQGSFAGR